MVESGGKKSMRLHSSLSGDLYDICSANAMKSRGNVDLHKPPIGTTLIGHALTGHSLFGGTSILGFSTKYEQKN